MIATAKNKRQFNAGSKVLRRATEALALLILLGLLSACQLKPNSPDLLQSNHFPSISQETPASLSFNATGAGPILVQVTGHEAEFESRIIDARGQILNKARIPYLRTGPVYQYLEAGPDRGPLEVRVSVTHITNNASVTVDVYQLGQEGQADHLLQQAYRHYSNGIQSTDSEAPEHWQPRVGELRLAANNFEQLGLKKQQLWSQLLVAQFTYFPLYELQSATEMARNVQAQAQVAGFPLLELMATQLEGQALIERDELDSPEIAGQKFDKAQQVLKKAAEMAREQGMRFEQAWAINNRGIGYYYQDLSSEALEQYRQVLQMAFDLEDAYLTTLVRGNIALINERLGNYAETLAALLEIRQELAQTDSGSEQAQNLIEIGRIYSKLFMFPEAIDALSKAMNISRELGNHEGTGRIGLSMARAYYDMGYRKRARDLLIPAINDMKVVHFGRGLREAYRLMADLYRFKGTQDLFEENRVLQGQYLTSDRDRAGYLFSLGLDSLAYHDTGRASALFAESHQTAIASGDMDLQIRSLLQHCILAPAQAVCETGRVESRLVDWLPRAVPRVALEARYTWARLLIGQGDDTAALSVLKDLVADIEIYRANLPGVLGIWYWESRQKVFSTYMDLLLEHAQSQQQIVNTLLVLDHLRNLEISSHRYEVTRDESRPKFNTDEIRALIAGMAQAPDDNARLEMSGTLDRLLLGSSASTDFKQGNGEDLLRGLTSLPRDTGYLTYYFSDAGAWAWLARQQDLQLIHLGDAKPILELLAKVRANLRMVGNDELSRNLEALGMLLIGSLGTSLPTTIYLGTTGEMAGLPFEAIRNNGRFLVQDHTIINLMSLEGLADLGFFEQREQKWDKVFLAGAPAKLDGNYADLAGAAIEIEEISRLFDGQWVQKITGADLKRKEFALPAFSEAELIHIASHGTINLDYPELSQLILSGQSDGGISDYLTPLEIRQFTIAARLVVLSACETTGLNDFSFDSNLGFVSEFLRSGAGAVIASLWPVPDKKTRDFMVDFYTALLEGADIPNALVMTKRKHMNAARKNGISDWVSFQVYVD